MDLFDPATYAGLRRPLREAETLPVECYTSEAFYKREVETIFMKCWNMLGREDFAKNPGDYFVRDVRGISLIVARGKDMKLRAFVNACRHRGTKMLDGMGQCKEFHCTYHGWAYTRDGSLRAFNAMDQAQNLDPKDFGLK